MPDRVEANQQQAHKSEIERETHQHNYHPVLRTNKGQWGRQEGNPLRTASSRTGVDTTSWDEDRDGRSQCKGWNDNRNYERTMEREGRGSMNDNRKRLDICTAYDFALGGPLFLHRYVHKLTWYSPNGRDRNQIDHLIINRMWTWSLLDVQVRRGADVGSDHHLVTATRKLKLRKTESSPRGRQHFDVEKLRDLKV